MADSVDPGIRTSLTWIAAVIATITALCIPSVYYFTAFDFETDRMVVEADHAADELSEIVYSYPKMWSFMSERLAGRLEAFHSDPSLSYRVLDLNGNLVIHYGAELGTPSISVSDVLSDGFRGVGTVEVGSSILHVWIQTVLAALVGVLLGAAMFAALRVLPLRALRRAMQGLEQANAKIKALNTGLERTVTERTKALRRNERALRDRIEQLEQVQHRLEMQGVKLFQMTGDLERARDQARAADRAKSEFLATMSHELRTPLNAVIGFSEVIKDETFGPVGSANYREYSRDIFESGNHLLALINDILDLSKIESGSSELCEETVQVAELIEAALRLVTLRTTKAGIEIGAEVLGPPLALRVDERKMKQVLVNLLANAVKFTGADGEVTLRAWGSKEIGFHFQVRDSGIGIASDDIPKALSRFGQVQGGLNRQFEGTGLGLPLSKALVEQHGGVLDLQSEVGVGTTVTVRLPAERIVALEGECHPSDANTRAAC